MGDSYSESTVNIDVEINNGAQDSSTESPEYPSYPNPDNATTDPSTVSPEYPSYSNPDNGTHPSSTVPPEYPSYPNRNNGTHYSSNLPPKSSPYQNNGTYDASKVSPGYSPAYPNPNNGPYDASKVSPGYSPAYPNPNNGTYNSSRSPPAYPPHPTAYQPPYPPQNSPYPPPSPFAHQPPRQRWSSGLFDCQQDDTNCAATAVSPCITFGQIAEIVDEGQTTCAMAGSMFSIMIACPWIYTFSYRTRLRKKYNLEEAPIMDALVHFLFLPCALCQEYRELKSRGLHPGLGWAGNQERPLPKTGMAAPPSQAMHR
ncbi:hypothetical protein SUGI_0036810 [Cryptomeria japonica]|uniref:cell number regulator 3 n=1 Tax=Cryptomeria japonica TaxID=3369 RepID=UPI002408B898|nr:cell number regulator 3 [Cryptomeria japonica]GLJ06343.1 hypothetical protein SUGI_0036810 [Cryptomeria japonica]